MMDPNQKVENVIIESDSLVLVFKDQRVEIPLRNISARLASADEELRNDFRLSPSGYGIHWNKLDEDISIPALLNQWIDKRHRA